MSVIYTITHHKKICKLKKMRIARGLTQKELSLLSGVPLKCIGNYEQNRRDINNASVSIVYKLAQTLSCSILDLIDI